MASSLPRSMPGRCGSSPPATSARKPPTAHGSRAFPKCASVLLSGRRTRRSSRIAPAGTSVPSMRPASRLDAEHHLVHVAPAPVLPLFGGADDRMPGLVGVLAGVLVLRGVAAAHVA